MKRLFAALAGGSLILSSGTAFAGEKVVRQDVTQNSSENSVNEIQEVKFSSKINSFYDLQYKINSSKSFLEFYQDVLRMQINSQKNDYETTSEYQDRVDPAKRLSALKFKYNENIFYLNDEFGPGTLKTSYNADQNILDVRIDGIYMKFPNSPIGQLQNSEFGEAGFPKKYFGAKCSISKSIIMDKYNAMQLREYNKLKFAIEFLPRFEADRIVDFRRYEVFKKLKKQISYEKVSIHSGYYEYNSISTSGPWIGTQYKFLYPNWEGAIVHVFDAGSGSILFSENCAMKHL
jgi:hypothetical protein